MEVVIDENIIIAVPKLPARGRNTHQQLENRDVLENLLIEGIIEKNTKEHEHDEKVPPLRVPKDKYLLCHVVFFLLGIAHFLPISFLNAAMNFWMYKFRNLSDPTMSPGNRTSLGVHFASIQIIVNTVPMFLVGVWNIIYGPKFKIMGRLHFTLFIQVMMYYVLTAFVKVDTDNYQTWYFVIVMACWGTLTGSNLVNVVATQLLYPRFPHSYMKTSIVAEGVSGIVGDLLNIFSVAVLDDVTDATLLYFLLGAGVITITFILTLLISKTEFFTYCLHTMPQDHKAGIPKRKAMFSVLYKIRLTIFMSFMMLVATSATHTSITSLVVSEQDPATQWASKFFSPVITFFWTDFCGLLGRLLAAHPAAHKLPDWFLAVISILRTVVLVPLLWFCNAQPRSHLSVLFPHDYQYAIIIGLFMFMNGFFMNIGMLLVPRKTTKQESEVAYTVSSLIMGIMATATSPIGTFVVDIL